MKIIIDDTNSQQRIDRFAQKILSNTSFINIQKLIRLKKIIVNEKKCTNNYMLKNGDVVDILINITNNSSNNNNSKIMTNIKIEVIYEDKNIIIINKPIGISCQADNNNEFNIIDWTAKYLKEKNEYVKSLTFTPGPVHRLDYNTTGLLIIAKNYISSKLLNDMFKQKQIRKYYAAKIHGIFDPKEGVLKDFLYKKKDISLVTIYKKYIQGSFEIITKYKTIKHNKTDSIVEIELITGKTHQIRAHLDFYKHSIFGEKKYNSLHFTDKEKYQQLCAYCLEFNFSNNYKELNYLNHKRISIDFPFTL